MKFIFNVVNKKEASEQAIMDLRVYMLHAEEHINNDFPTIRVHLEEKHD
jgi:hypothetical protein